MVDILISRPRLLLEKGHRLHDLARLAIAALRHIVRHPGLLHRVQTLSAQALDRGDLTAGSGLHRSQAGANSLAILVYRTGAAESHAAAVLGARKAQNIAQIPEQRHLRIAVEGVCSVVDL